jgi:hypothetical protein
MKTTLLSALTMTVLIGANSAQAPQSSPAAPVPAQQLTQTQAAHLIGAASTPGDHRELAQYFRREAEQKRPKVRYYSEVAATYRVHPPRVDAYRNMSTAEYYQHLANEARNAALSDDQTAALHDKLAEGIEQAK